MIWKTESQRVLKPLPTEALASPEDLLRPILSGNPPPWPEHADTEFEARFVNSASSHGVRVLIHRALQRCAAAEQWPADVLKRLADASMHDTLVELVRKRELARLLAALADAGIHPLLMKGTPLAYTHYPFPSLRPKTDTDLLIRHADLADLPNVLANLAYEALGDTHHETATCQLNWARQDKYGVTHILDIHWRVNNRQLFASALSYDELNAQAIPVPKLGEHARGLGPAHALLLACMHRIAHMPSGDHNRMIWLYDIHLLVSDMNSTQRGEFALWAQRKKLAQICADGLEQSRRHFHTPASEMIAMLQRNPVREPASTYLRQYRGKLRRLREFAFPSLVAMHSKYAVSSGPSLPLLYLRRAFAALSRHGLSGTWNLLRNA